MRAHSHELPIAMEQDGVVSRQVQWGEMNVAVETGPAGMDTRPLFRNLPHDSCQCPHWGYVIRGRARVVYADHEEVIAAGDVYYLSPGHNIICEEDGELVEFSPKGKYPETMEAVARNAVGSRRPASPARPQARLGDSWWPSHAGCRRRSSRTARPVVRGVRN